MRIPNTKWQPINRVDHGQRGTTKGVIIHTIEGSDEGALGWFANPDSGGVGAHLVIGHTPPRAVQIADLNDLLWHAAGGNTNYIGIEHEGKASDSLATWKKRETQRKLSANRVAWICYNYKLGKPKRKVNVFGHVDFPAGGHHDPGPGFWCEGLYMAACERAYKNLVNSNGKRWT